jgi:hypothetical protein
MLSVQPNAQLRGRRSMRLWDSKKQPSRWRALILPTAGGG